VGRAGRREVGAQCGLSEYIFRRREVAVAVSSKGKRGCEKQVSDIGRCKGFAMRLVACLKLKLPMWEYQLRGSVKSSIFV
jgi:hypothetical protein